MIDSETDDFRKTAIIYLLMIAAASVVIYQLFQTVFPRGLSNETGCERVWEAVGLTRSTSTELSSVSSRVGILWECADNVKGFGVLSIYACFWVCLKAFAIPGSMILCVALGGLLPFWQAQLTATFCELVGGSCCYVISGHIGGPLLKRFSPSLLSKFQHETEARRQKGDLFYFALFVRMTPLIPNWFVNAASPLVGIPYPIFAGTTVLGIQIATFMSIRAGATLFLLGKDSINGDSFLQGQGFQSFGLLLVAQFVALIPVYLGRKEHENVKGSLKEKAASKLPLKIKLRVKRRH